MFALKGAGGWFGGEGSTSLLLSFHVDSRSFRTIFIFQRFNITSRRKTMQLLQLFIDVLINANVGF